MRWIDEHYARLVDVRTVVFDWDGTLADSIDNIVSCMQLAATSVGLAAPTNVAVREIIGLGLFEAVEVLFPGAEVALIERTVEAYRHHYLLPEHRGVTLFPGVPELLDDLEDAGFLLAVATGKSRRGLDRALAESGLKDCFVTTRTVDECHSKPHPQMLQEIADYTGVTASQVLMVGDGVMDMQMAANAGMVSVAVATGAGEPGDLLAEGAVGCIESIGGLSFLAGQTIGS
jgi:phosphoglycolate phosphatase